jgi:hypothetical protein
MERQEVSSVGYAEHNYAPMIIAAIEKEIGERAMWKWMKAILETSGLVILV